MAKSQYYSYIGVISLGLIWVKADWVVRIRIWLLNIFFSVLEYLLITLIRKNQFCRVFLKEELVFKIEQKLNSTAKNKRYEITAFHQNQPFKAVLSVPKIWKNWIISTTISLN